jgi:hypothetical protein
MLVDINFVFENVTWHFGFGVAHHMKFVKHTHCYGLRTYDCVTAFIKEFNKRESSGFGVQHISPGFSMERHGNGGCMWQVATCDWSLQCDGPPYCTTMPIWPLGSGEVAFLARDDVKWYFCCYTSGRDRALVIGHALKPTASSELGPRTHVNRPLILGLSPNARFKPNPCTTTLVRAMVMTMNLWDSWFSSECRIINVVF